MVTASSTMQALLKLVARFADSDAPVAVLGETGTGKEVVARLLHANSARARQPFVAVNVAALPSELLESELFGHGKGAYTGASSARQGLFEAANGGTLFLDEIGEMPPALQAKLLRVLQDGEVRRIGENTAFAVDARIICATHRDLAERVREGTFREDLFYRLKVLTLHVPPLRARRDDIISLAEHFLAQEKREAQSFSTDAKTRLLSYSWPGNVRELQNVVKYAAAVATDTQVDEGDLPDEVRSASVIRGHGRSNGSNALLTLAEVERRHILSVLDACGGSQRQAADILGVGRNTLWRKIRRYT
jgi:two-component system response regulator HydG